MDFVSIGHILNEVIIAQDRSRQYVLGSPAAYTTVCASRLGAQVGLVSHVGNDMPVRLLSVFDETGVDLTGLNKKSPCTTANELGYDDKGRKRILRYFKVAPPITIDCIPEKYYRSLAFYIGGLNFEVQPDVLKKLSTFDSLIMGDFGGLGGTGQPLDGESLYLKDRSFFRDYVSNFQIVKASDDDCMLITGSDAQSVPEFLKEVLSWGPETVLLTKGAAGTEVMTSDDNISIPAYPVENPVDTTGAGDCFSAGFLFRYVQTDDVIASVQFGSMVSHFVVQKSGGVVADRMPTQSQIVDIWDCFNEIKN